jgi:DNA-binding MarR family transcriptional regulator
MVTRIRDEIKQTRPFRSLEEEVLVALARTTDRMQRGMSVVLKAAGLSTTQYNVLRILRGAGPAGLSCGEITERMVTRDPDLTRLLDRLESRQLVTRARDGADRRVVTTKISEAGLSVLAGLDDPLRQEQRRLLAHVGEDRLRSLAGLLDLVRAGSP